MTPALVVSLTYDGIVHDLPTSPIGNKAIQYTIMSYPDATYLASGTISDLPEWDPVIQKINEVGQPMSRQQGRLVSTNNLNMVCRAAWWSKLRGVDTCGLFSRNHQYDLIEQFNGPAILSLRERQQFCPSTALQMIYEDDPSIDLDQLKPASKLWFLYATLIGGVKGNDYEKLLDSQQELTEGTVHA